MEARSVTLLVSARRISVPRSFADSPRLPPLHSPLIALAPTVVPGSIPSRRAIAERSGGLNPRRTDQIAQDGFSVFSPCP